MAFLVAEQRDPDHKGMMPELRQRTTQRPVAQARNRVKVKPDCVYVILPNRDLSILHLTTSKEEMQTLNEELHPGDVGRPLTDIVTDLAYPGLREDADEVLRALAFSDREVSTHDGRWYQVKIMSHRTLENMIDGAVITFNDISAAKQLEAQLRVNGGQTKESS